MNKQKQARDARRANLPGNVARRQASERAAAMARIARSTQRASREADALLGLVEVDMILRGV